jgi:hypothetical protein
MNRNDDIFEGVENVVDVDTSVKNVILNDAPLITSPEWSDYVMSLFKEDELINGMPISAGLRRVAELVLGPIVDSGPLQVFPPKEDHDHGRATVMWRVEFANGTRYADVADSWEGNTDENFCPYTVATAATRAEARSLRKALRLRKVSADEVTTKDTTPYIKANLNKKDVTEGEYEDKHRMTDPQANFLDVKLKQLNVDGKKFLKDMFKINSVNITKSQATAAITRLNDFQNNSEEIPENILGYKSEWRN